MANLGVGCYGKDRKFSKPGIAAKFLYELKTVHVRHPEIRKYKIMWTPRFHARIKFRKGLLALLGLGILLVEFIRVSRKRRYKVVTLARDERLDPPSSIQGGSAYAPLQVFPPRPSPHGQEHRQ